MKKYYFLGGLVVCLSFFISLAGFAQTTVYNYTGTYDTYVVPAGVSSINIEALGGQGAAGDPSYSGGLGASMSGDFAVTPGETLIIVVGGEGQGAGSNSNGGGGGGTFVVRESPGSGFTIASGPFAGTDVEPMIIAGGGGGTRAAVAQNGNPGVVTETATTASGSSTTGGGAVSGATPGYGGVASSSSWGSAGGGFIGNGGSDGSYGNGGSSFLNGAAGGTGGTGGGDNAAGGFGAGGQGRGWYGGGGGGGYTGGDGGRVAGGGGSYNVGTDQVNVGGVNSGDGQVTISVNCLALDVVVSDDGICNGELVNLDATSIGGGTITWDGGVTNGVDFTPPADAVTTYTATSSDPNDCDFVIDISSVAIPTIVANATETDICEGEAITLTGSGGDTYSWDMGATDGDPIFPTTTTTYTVTGSLMGCEGPTDDITINVVAKPNVIGTSTPASICVGETYVLTSSGTADTYDWGIGVTEGATIVGDVPGDYVYTVIGVETASGCSDTVDVLVTVHDNPVIDAGDDMIVCEGEEVTLSATGADTYVWDNGVSDGTPFTAGNIGPTTYTVLGTDANGCEGTDEVVITVLDAPNATGVVTHETTGFNGAIDLTTSGGSGSSYTWSWDTGATSEDLSGLVAGDYTVVIFDGACEATYTFTVLNTLDVDGEDFTTLNIYPNPVQDVTTIEFNGEFTYTFYNSLGQVIMTDFATDKAIVDLSSLESGVYLVEIKTENGSRSLQVTKQ